MRTLLCSVHAVTPKRLSANFRRLPPADVAHPVRTVLPERDRPDRSVAVCQRGRKIYLAGAMEAKTDGSFWPTIVISSNSVAVQNILIEDNAVSGLGGWAEIAIAECEFFF